MTSAIPVQNFFFFQVLLTTTSFSSVLSCEDLLISSSSSYYGLYRAVYGRLNGYRGGGWCSNKTDSNSERLQVDIGEIIQACGLAIQGTSHRWIKAFKLSNCQ